MFQRLSRAFRSFFGFFVSTLEDPELILEQNIRDLNDQVPKMNESIAMVRANVGLLEKEEAKHRAEVLELTSKVKAGIQAGRDDIAAGFANKLEASRAALRRSEQQLALAKEAYDKAIVLKKGFLREKERKTQSAMNAIRDHRRAQWQSKVADAMESFQVGGIDQTHGEMLRRIEEKTALNEARMQLALDSVDSKSIAIEEDAEQIRASELVKQFKLEMGMLEEPTKAEKAPLAKIDPIAA
jgi:phage shock protein A